MIGVDGTACACMVFAIVMHVPSNHLTRREFKLPKCQFIYFSSLAAGILFVIYDDRHRSSKVCYARCGWRDRNLIENSIVQRHSPVLAMY